MWLNLSFQDRARFIIDQIVFFYDFSFLVISMILIFVVYMMFVFATMSLLNRFIIDNQTLEFIWTILPLLILVFIAFPSIRILYLMDEVKGPVVTCKVIGHQWFWSYEYSDFNHIEFDSYIVFNFIRLLEVDNFFVLPIASKIRVIVRSFDVLHSWTVPSLGVKVDAVPGRLNQLNFVLNRFGVFFGQCSEICGANHRFMPVGLEVVSFKVFCDWVIQGGSD